MVGKGGTKESLEWRFYGPATSLFDVETSRTGTKVVVRRKTSLSAGEYAIKRISPRLGRKLTYRINLHNRVT